MIIALLILIIVLLGFELWDTRRMHIERLQLTAELVTQFALRHEEEAAVRQLPRSGRELLRARLAERGQ